MRRFTYSCGQRLYFGNKQCMRCHCTLGYGPAAATLLTLEPEPAGLWRSLPAEGRGQRYRQFANYRDYQVCNWAAPGGVR